MTLELCLIKERHNTGRWIQHRSSELKVEPCSTSAFVTGGSNRCCHLVSPFIPVSSYNLRLTMTVWPDQHSWQHRRLCFWAHWPNNVWAGGTSWQLCPTWAWFYVSQSTLCFCVSPALRQDAPSSCHITPLCVPLSSTEFRARAVVSRHDIWVLDFWTSEHSLIPAWHNQIFSYANYPDRYDVLYCSSRPPRCAASTEVEARTETTQTALKNTYIIVDS